MPRLFEPFFTTRPQGTGLGLAVARAVTRAHGGNVSLVGIEDGTAYLRFGGGCQGCGMISVTLKQGVEKAILQFGGILPRSLFERMETDNLRPRQAAEQMARRRVEEAMTYRRC